MGKTVVLDGEQVAAEFIVADPRVEGRALYQLLEDHPTNREYRAGRIVSIRDTVQDGAR